MDTFLDIFELSQNRMLTNDMAALGPSCMGRGFEKWSYKCVRENIKKMKMRQSQNEWMNDKSRNLLHGTLICTTLWTNLNKQTTAILAKDLRNAHVKVLGNWFLVWQMKGGPLREAGLHGRLRNGCCLVERSVLALTASWCRTPAGRPPARRRLHFTHILTPRFHAENTYFCNCIHRISLNHYY